MQDVVELARRLIEVPSVTGDEAAAAELAAEALRRAAYDVQAVEVEPGRPNVLATRGEPHVLLCTHLDTVPPHLPVREDATWLHGRGACDAKGIMAAMIVAAEALAADGVEDLGVLLVVGEETDSIGARHANEHLDLPEVRFTIVGEPTESKFARAQKGGMQVRLRARGRAAHSGYPEQGRSAIEALLEALALARAADWGTDAVLGPGTLNIGVIHGGERANIVPAEAEAQVFVRIVDSAAASRARVEALAAAGPPGVAWEVLSANDPQQLATIPGAPETVVAFNTDVPHLTRMGTPLLMGPGSILVAHSPEERIAKPELRAAVPAYQRAVRHLLDADSPRGGSP